VEKDVDIEKQWRDGVWGDNDSNEVDKVSDTSVSLASFAVSGEQGLGSTRALLETAVDKADEPAGDVEKQEDVAVV
jgi:hypothetical protein